MNTLQTDDIGDALARAVVYRTLSLAFQPPTDERLSQMGADRGFATVRAALTQMSGHSGGAGLEMAANRLGSVSPAMTEAAGITFVRLFGHTARGLVCACETEYGPDNGFHQPQQLADLAGYYLAFGLRPIVAADVRLDHIACECEFMDFLNRKEVVLLAEDDAPGTLETLDATRRAARRFLREHLAHFGCGFATRVTKEDRYGYFGILGQLLLAVLKAECLRLGIEAGPVDLPLRPDHADDVPMACGSGAGGREPQELIQIQRPKRQP